MRPSDFNQILVEFRAVTVGASEGISKAAKEIVKALVEISLKNNDKNRAQLHVAVTNLTQMVKPGVQFKPADLQVLKSLQPVLQQAGNILDAKNQKSYDGNVKLVKKAELAIQEKMGRTPQEEVKEEPKPRSPRAGG